MINQENTLIPFHAATLPEGPWLIFAPHADDETFGMGGTILKAKDEEIDTHLVVLTDGSQGGDELDLAEIRINEVRRAAGILGLKSLDCWSEPDRLLYPSDKLVKSTSAKLLEIKPATVFFPGPLEIHPDHRAASHLVWAALRQVRQLNFNPVPIYYEIGVQNPINLLIDVTEQYINKEKVMQVYESQNKENNYPELVLALNKGRTFSLPPEVKFAEGFFEFQNTDLELSLDEMTYSIIRSYLAK